MVTWGERMTSSGESVRSHLAASRAVTSIASNISKDADEFSENYDGTAPPTGLDMAGHDTHLMGPKMVMLDSFVVDLLEVDTSAQTFKLKLILNMDWEDDGTIEPEVKLKRNLGASVIPGSDSMGTIQKMESASTLGSSGTDHSSHGRSFMSAGTYKTGKYVLKREFREDPLGTTWNPEVVLVNAIADEDPIEAGSKLHSVEVLSGRPIVSRSVLYQPECRCAFTFSNFPFEETDLVVKFSSNKWNSEQVNFQWSNRLSSMGRDAHGRRKSMLPGARGVPRRDSFSLDKSVDKGAVGGTGLSEFEIIKVRVETEEKEVDSMQRYDNAEGGFSQAHLIIRVRRDPYSYLLRVVSVAMLLMYLEVLSFWTDADDVSDRFSVSGTIFLAMVELYGPMANALPKVSVVTRVDMWHLFNFLLLFVSNMENLLAFMVRKVISKRVMECTEMVLGVLYLCAVTGGLLWFIQPLYERDDFASIVHLFEDAWDSFREALYEALPWCSKRAEGGAGGRRLSTAATKVRSTVRIKTGGKKNDKPQANPGGVTFND